MSSWIQLGRTTAATFAGMGVGVAGLLVQWFANPARFGGFPPGIYVLVGCAVLIALTSRWWWHTVFGVLISLFIVVGGTLAGDTTANFRSGNLGTIAGTAVMTIGLLFAAVAGVYGMVVILRRRTTARAG